MSAAVDALVAIVKAINAVLSVIPALVWAIVLVLVFGWGGVMRVERDAAVSAKNVIQASLDQLTARVVRQKNEAAALLRQLTAERDALQVRINDAHRAQEIKDANDRKVIADQAARLRTLVHAGQLRDPNAAGCGRGGPVAESHAVADERGGEEHAAPAGGLVSAPLSRLLFDTASDADKWGRLYGLARADAMTCRAALGSGP